MSTAFLIISIFQFLNFQSVALASTADLSIDQSSISFSGDLVAGSTVRVYAEVNNVGDVDVDGYVTFYQGSSVLGQSLVISVRAEGVPEEVYVDFVVPSASFNIRAVIGGTEPLDSNSANDDTMTKLISPVPDADGDGIADAKDNCVSMSNADQTDTDGDGLGNACDDDDDNDGVTDDVERENGSNPLVTDTDKDGVSDAKDAYPTDKARSKIEPVVVPVPAPLPVAAPAVSTTAPKPAVTTTTAAPAASTAVATSSPVPAETQAETVAVAETVQPAIPEPTASTATEISPKAIFLVTRTAWNAYFFKAVVPEADGYQYAWDFGDGVSSSRAEVQHTFTTSGDFTVAFTVTDPSGIASTDSVVAHVPFWTLQNKVVDVIVAFLSFLLLLGLGMVLRLSRLSKMVANAVLSSVAPVGAKADASMPAGRHGVIHENTIGEEDEALDHPKAKRLSVRNLDE